MSKKKKIFKIAGISVLATLAACILTPVMFFAGINIVPPKKVIEEPKKKLSLSDCFDEKGNFKR